MFPPFPRQEEGRQAGLARGRLGGRALGGKKQAAAAAGIPARSTVVVACKGASILDRKTTLGLCRQKEKKDSISHYLAF